MKLLLSIFAIMACAVARPSRFGNEGRRLKAERIANACGAVATSCKLPASLPAQPDWATVASSITCIRQKISAGELVSEDCRAAFHLDGGKDEARKKRKHSRRGKRYGHRTKGESYFKEMATKKLRMMVSACPEQAAECRMPNPVPAEYNSTVSEQVKCMKQKVWAEGASLSKTCAAYVHATKGEKAKKERRWQQQKQVLKGMEALSVDQRRGEKLRKFAEACQEVASACSLPSPLPQNPDWKSMKEPVKCMKKMVKTDSAKLSEACQAFVMEAEEKRGGKWEKKGMWAKWEKKWDKKKGKFADKMKMLVEGCPEAAAACEVSVSVSETADWKAAGRELKCMRQKLIQTKPDEKCAAAVKDYKKSWKQSKAFINQQRKAAKKVKPTRR